MAASIRMLTTRANADSATSVNMTIPAGAQIGDIVVVQHVNSGSSTVLGWPTGWTGQEVTPEFDFSMAVSWKQLVSGDPGANLTWTADQSTNHTVRGIVVQDGTTTDMVTNLNYGGETTATTSIPTTYDTTATDSLVLQFVSNDPSAAGTYTPSAFTEQWDEDELGADLLHAYAGSLLVASITSGGTDTVTCSASQEHLWACVAIQPGGPAAQTISPAPFAPGRVWISS